MRVHIATTPFPATTALGRNPTPSTSTTMLRPNKNMGTKTREMVDRLVPLQHMGKASCSPLGATNRDGNPTNREHDGRLSLQPPPPNKTISPPPIKPCNALQQWCRHSAPFSFQHPIGACPDYTRTSFLST